MIITEKKIRKIIRSLLESSLEDLEKKYEEDIIAKNNDYNLQFKNNKNIVKKWDLLNYTIDILKSLNNPDPKIYGKSEFSLEEKSSKILEILQKDLGFSKIGQGAYRQVYGREDATFIIKISGLEYSYLKKKYLGLISKSNEKEYNKYFNYGTDSLPRNDLFPKIYSFDEKDYLWLIAEKVNPFNTNNPLITIFDVFSPFINLLIGIYKKVMNDINLSNYPNFQDCIKPSNFYNSIVDKNKHMFVFGKIFDFINDVSFSYDQKGDLQEAFNKNIKNFFISQLIAFDDFKLNKYMDLSSSNDNQNIKYTYEEVKNAINFFEMKLSKYTSELIITPDIAYISKFLKNGYINDLHYGNIGYRDSALTYNKSKPWESFVILDFGE
jgi:hypothetical protein